MLFPNRCTKMSPLNFCRKRKRAQWPTSNPSSKTYVSALEDLPSEFIIQEGSPSEVLLWLSEIKSVDLLAVGSHGHRRMQRLLLGSVAEKLSRQARCPVLVTPESSLPQKFSLRTILCPTNFSERSAAALKKDVAVGAVVLSTRTAVACCGGRGPEQGRSHFAEHDC